MKSVHTIVGWIPMLDSDERAAADEISRMFADKPVPQFFDGTQRFGKELARSLGMASDFVAWDIFLFYPPGAEWTASGLPLPEKAIAQARPGVIALKGTLPPKGDQSELPDWAAGKTDLVGTRDELGALLTQIAVPFVERHRKPK